MKHEAEGETGARADYRHTVTHRCRRPAPGRLDGPVAGGEDQAVTVRDQCGGATLLSARALLGEQELPAGVIRAGVVEVDHDLEREHKLVSKGCFVFTFCRRPIVEVRELHLDGCPGGQPVDHAGVESQPQNSVKSPEPVAQPPRSREALREVVAQSLEQAPAAFLAARPVGPELVEEDAVLDVREPGALVDRLEL